MDGGGAVRWAAPRAVALGVVGLALAALARIGGEGAVEAVAGPPAEAAPAVVDAPPDAGPPESPAARALREGRPMDVNGATAEDLELLPRVGPALSARIVASREAEGLFRSVDDLARVRGIGPRTVDRLRPLVIAVMPTDGGPPTAGGPAPSIGSAPW